MLGSPAVAVPTGPDPTQVLPSEIVTTPMPALPRATRASSAWITGIRSVRRHSLAGLSLLAVAGIAAAGGIPASAQPARHDEAGQVTARPTAGEQRFTVPSSVRTAPIVRDAGVTVTIAASPAASSAASTWVPPIVGPLRDGFGPRPIAPVAGVNPFHSGQDIPGACGAPVRAAAAGRVVQAGWSGSYGYWVLLDNGGGIRTGYAHSGRLLVTAGQRVASGAAIAEVGTTGASTGCHVHFETRLRDKAVDPVAFLRARGVRLGP